jgi:prophage DNA circulation protein
MANENEIFLGSYKEIPIRISGGSLEGGRRKAIKLFPNKNTQSVEDMGAIPRKYKLEIILSDSQANDYFGYRKQLLASFESPTPGTLIHPFYGRIDNVVSTTYNLNENFGEFGSAIISVSFEITENIGIPQDSGLLSSKVISSNIKVQDSLKSFVGNSFKVSNNVVSNINDATNKVNNIIDSSKSATSFVGGAIGTLTDFVNDSTAFVSDAIGTVNASNAFNVFNATLADFQTDVVSAVLNPAGVERSLSGYLNSTFREINGLYKSPLSTYNVFKKFFKFGNDDKKFKITTHVLKERKYNREVLNSYVKASSFSYAQLAAISIDYATTNEIDSVAFELDNQYLEVMESEIDQITKDQISETRLLVTQALQEVRVRTSTVISIETNLTTARLIAFNYYGSDELGEAICDLNSFKNVSFVEGQVEILRQ